MLDISNLINISVNVAPTGLGSFNVNNVALFTGETPVVDPGDYGVYVSASAVATDWGTGSEAYLQALAFFSQSPNPLNGGGALIIFKAFAAAETLAEAIERTKDLIFYCGILSTAYPSDDGVRQDLADAVQAYGNKILIFPSNTEADIAGIFTDIKDAGDYFTRCLYYSVGAQDSRIMAAAYAGRGFSTNFSGSNTTETMNAKALTTIDADEDITQTVKQACTTAGVDIYVNIAGISCVLSNGANRYFDQVYNQVWLVSALQVAGFNALRQTNTKVPQTEPGVNVLKNAYRTVLDQGVINAYVAPGRWTSPDTFGNSVDMLAQIEQRGYYVYSQPVNQQLTADREARKAPLIQIAYKESGAIHTSNVTVSINA